MTPYWTDKLIDQAIATLQCRATQDIVDLSARARQNGAERLVVACGAELKLRPFRFSGELAKGFKGMADRVAGAPLRDSIRHAFGVEVPARDYEERILRKIAEVPGISFRDLLNAYGKGDASLVIGHFVFDRFGCFRHLLKPGDVQSDLLLHREKSAAGKCYRLRTEAADVFRELKVI